MDRLIAFFGQKRAVTVLGTLCVLSIALILWLFLGYIPAVKRNAILEIRNKYPLLDAARNFIPQEDFIVNLQLLREDLRNMVRWEHPRAVSLYFEFLNTGANIAINQDLAVWPASFPKVPMAMAVMKKVEEGVWSFDQEFELLERDKDSNYGTLFNSPPGTRFTVRELLRAMLVQSDNTAYWIFLRNMSTEELDRVTKELGLEDLFTPEGLVSSKEYSRLFRSIYTSSYLKRDYSTEILKLLSESDFDDFLASGFPSEVVFAHKFGIDRIKNAYLDSGIVYVENRPYLLTVAVQGNGEPGEEERVDAFMKAVAERTYGYISSQ